MPSADGDGLSSAPRVCDCVPMADKSSVSTGGGVCPRTERSVSCTTPDQRLDEDNDGSTRDAASTRKLWPPGMGSRPRTTPDWFGTMVNAVGAGSIGGFDDVQANELVL